ncbi:MAG: Crp/Fnr family transcriptional regulator [Actinomycetota bacterium]
MRRKASGAQMLANVPLFSQCTPRERARIGALLTEIRVPAGKTLCTEGTAGRECFIVADGRAKATLRRRKLANFGPGAFFGEMSLLDGGPRTATIVAETPMTLYVLSPRDLAGLTNDFPSVTTKMLRVLAQRLRAAEKAPTA